MKIIGVTGKSGAGKTTFSNFLGERKNVGVIHVDEIFNNLKETKFKRYISKRDKNNKPSVFTPKIRMFINSNKLTFRLSMAIKKVLIKKEIEKRIKNFKKQGKDAIIVDSTHLQYLTNKEIYNKTIYITRAYEDRKKSLEERDDITKEEMLERDIPFKRKFSKVKLREYDYVIENKYGEEELKAASEKIYDEVVGKKTFEERYVIKQKDSSHKNIVRTPKKVSTKSRTEKER